MRVFPALSGLVPAPGLRAGDAGPSMKPQTDKEIAMNCTRGLMNLAVPFALVTLVVATACSAGAPGASVRGHGRVINGGNDSPSEISVDTWVDADGAAHGMIVWVGDVHTGHPAGPADPWIIDVEEISFFGNVAIVAGTVAHSVFPGDIGNAVVMSLMDNSGTGEPHEINGDPIVAGNITVTD